MYYGFTGEETDPRKLQAQNRLVSSGGESDYRKLRVVAAGLCAPHLSVLPSRTEQEGRPGGCWSSVLLSVLVQVMIPAVPAWGFILSLSLPPFPSPPAPLPHHSYSLSKK